MTARRMFEHVAVIALLANGGCSSARRRAPTLKDIGPSLNLEVEVTEDGRVRLTGFRDPKTMDQSRGCSVPAPGARAYLNRRELVRDAGPYLSPSLAYNQDCILAFHTRNAGEASEHAPGANRALVRIEDGTAEITVDVPDAFVRRSLVVLRPPGGELRRGRQVQLQWRPATDRLPRELGVTVQHDGLGPFSIPAASVDVQATNLTFQLPAALPSSYDGRVRMSITGYGGASPLYVCSIPKCSVTITANPGEAVATVVP